MASKKPGYAETAAQVGGTVKDFADSFGTLDDEVAVTKRAQNQIKSTADQPDGQQQADDLFADVKTRFGVRGQIAAVAWATRYLVTDCGRIFSRRSQSDTASGVKELRNTTEKSTGYQQVGIYVGGKRKYHDRGQPTPEPLHREILEAQAAYLKATGWERPRYRK